MNRIVARALALTWAGWWAFFGLASGISEGLSPLGVLLHAALPGGVFLASAVIAWRWEMVGGLLLILEGFLIAAAYPLVMHGRYVAFVLPTMALPPLVAGVLLLGGGRNAASSP